MSNKPWTAPAIHSDYGQLRQTLEARATAGGIDRNQVEVIHSRWTTLGKLVAAGRLK